jgi:hypothetical protein
MRVKWLVRLTVLVGVLACGPVHAETWFEAAMAAGPAPPRPMDVDAAVFEGLIPGEPLAEEELVEYYGKNIPVSINVGGDGVITFQGDISSSSTNHNNSSITGNEGIAQVVPVIGNHNDVDIGVSITVNINTVTVQDTTGSDVHVNQVLDFNGVLSGPFSR